MSCSPKPFSLAISLWLIFASLPALAVPIAVDDSFSVSEDGRLELGASPLIQTGFEAGGGEGFDVVFDGAWDFLDQIENVNGAADDYPVDGAGLDWNAPGFDVATSSVGVWSSGEMPLQAGGVDGFPNAAEVLGGIDAAANGGNLVTTYLFRNEFTLTTQQAQVGDWAFNLLVDDGCVIYINGVEVLRRRMGNGVITTESLATGTPNESVYENLEVAVGQGVLVAGVNTIAVEVHQQGLSSTDVGIDLSLAGGVADGPTGGFTFVDDPFNTSLPFLSLGQHEESSGFDGTGALRVRAGGNAPGDAATSAGWRRTFSLSSAATVEVSLRYRLVVDSGFESDEFALAVAAVDGVFIGNAENDSLFRVTGDGNGGGDVDTGFQQVTLSVPLEAGLHTLDLGVFVNQSTANTEVADAWFDDVSVSGGSAGGVLANDSGDADLMAELLTGATNGSVVLAEDGTFIYTPDADFFGDDSFTYRSVDGSGSSPAATVSLVVTPVNDAPVAIAHSYSVAEDETLSVGAANGLLQGATDIDSGAVDFVAVSGDDASSGTLIVNPNGAFSYTPNQNFNGVETFSFSVSDGANVSDPRIVTITVTPVDDAPEAVGDFYTVGEDETLRVSVASGSSENVFPLIFVSSLWSYLDDGSDQGLAWIAPDFDDSSWALGIGQFGYGDGDEQTLIDFGPDENNKYATTYFRQSFELANPEVIGSLELQLLRDDGAAVYLNGSEIVRSNLVDGATFDTRASTSTDNENSFLSFDVDPAPLRAGTNYLAVEIHQHDGDSSDLGFDLSLNGIEPVQLGVLDNDRDVDGEALAAAILQQPANGSVVMNADGTFVYTPASKFFGEDTFQYRVTSGALSSVGTATVTVTPAPNDPPVGLADAYSIVEDGVLSVPAATGVLANDSDLESDILSAELVTDVSAGSLSLDADGSFVYTPAANFAGSVSFVYRAADRVGFSADTVVTISVQGVNDPPRANPDTFVVQPGEDVRWQCLGQ